MATPHEIQDTLFDAVELLWRLLPEGTVADLKAKRPIYEDMLAHSDGEPTLLGKLVLAFDAGQDDE